MVLFKIIFGLVIITLMSVMGYLLYVHGKYENIIINMSCHDKVTTKNGSVVVVDNVCRILMNVYYFDNKNEYHQVTWSEFMELVGTYNLARAYNKSHGIFDKLIIGC